jgi:hypothetical protein
MADNKICFVISPIGKEGTDIRLRSDQVMKHIIVPVAEECGYDEVIRADKISAPGMITTQVINHILNDAMVVADLTDHNANVFYELAVRHAVRKPLVQIIQTGQPIPFDVAGMRTIDFDHTDLDSVANAKAEIKKQMESTSARVATLESPISVAIDLETLRRSDDPAKRQLADILNALSELKALIDTRLPATTIPYNVSLSDTLDYLDAANQRIEAVKNWVEAAPPPYGTKTRPYGVNLLLRPKRRETSEEPSDESTGKDE